MGMQITDVGKFIYDTETKNISFLQVAQDLRRLGIKNNMFFLKLYDKRLQGIDPHGPIAMLSDEIVFAMVTECQRNVWYYLREVARIPDQGNSKGIPYKLNRANLAATWCFVNNIDHYLTIPRQTGKTQSIIANLTWAYLFGTSNSAFAFFATSQELASENLDRLKTQRSLLPPFLQMREQCVIDAVLNTKDVEVDNMRKIYNPLSKNTIVTKSSAKSTEAAMKLGRGNTLPITYMDETEFISYIDTIVEAAGPAFSTASENAKRNKSAYCRIFSSTPGDLDSPSGIAASKILDKTYKWSEGFYDMDINKVKEIIDANAENGIIYIEYSYKQLGLDEKWFRKLCKVVNNNTVAIKREILLQRIRGSNDSPFEEEDLMAIQEIKPNKVEEFYVNELFRVDVYKKLRKDFPYIVGIDCSLGVGIDNTAVSIVNPYTLQVDAEFRNAYMSGPDVKKFIFTLVRKYIPNALLCIERNANGSTIIDDLALTSISRNIWYNPSKDLVSADSKVKNGSLIQEAETRRMRGVYTGSKSRELMMALLYETVAEHKDRLTSDFVIDDILKLVIKKGKIQAGAGAHDDSIMSYLIALYVYTYAKNLSRWGIIRGAKEPGTDPHDDGGAQEADAYEYMKENLSDEEYSMFAQQHYMADVMANLQKQRDAEMTKLMRESEALDNRVNALNAVSDLDAMEYEYDYDKAKETGGWSTYQLDEFDDLNDW